jgi:TatD DNase family protein
MEKMVYIDSHCHLHDPRIIADISGIVSRARAADVRCMVSCATAEENFESTRRLSKEFPGILPCFGIHPWFVHTISRQWKQNLEACLLSCPSGIGEAGIDFTDKTCDRDRQIRVFQHHLILARQLERPINIHIRKAWDTFIHLLKKTGKLTVPGLIHSYSGSADMIPFFESHGLYISFSGSVTNPGAKKVVAALKSVSNDRFVLETDTPDIYPYLPGPRTSRLNEPGNLPLVAKIAAGRINMDLEKFAAHAHDNSLAVFGSMLEKKQENQ